jgi:hypothetical protein
MRVPTVDMYGHPVPDKRSPPWCASHAGAIELAGPVLSKDRALLPFTTGPNKRSIREHGIARNDCASESGKLVKHDDISTVPSTVTGSESQMFSRACSTLTRS